MPSEWTVETAMTHVLGLLAAHDQRYAQRFDAQQSALDAALRAVKEAVDVTAINAERWRQNANEWRGAMDDRERLLMPRALAEQQLLGLSEKLGLLSSRLDKLEGRSAGLSSGWGYLLGLVAVAASIVGLITFFR